MANEIQFNGALQASKGGAAFNKSASCSLDMTGAQLSQNTLLLTTAWTLLVFGNLAGVPKKMMLINRSAVNYIELAEDNAGAHLQDRIQPNNDFVIRSPVAAIYAKANTASCLIEFAAMDA